MFFKVMGLHCEVCDKETQVTGIKATMKQVLAQARMQGWAVSSAGHFCPEHRRRPAVKG